MRAIRKGTEPRLWVEHRSTAGAAYDGKRGAGPTPEAMQALREALAREQGHLCCYCMQRIEPTASAIKVEHWRPQSTHPEAALEYANLLGACRGGEGSPRYDHHCDTARGSAPLNVNPTDPNRNCTGLFRYLADGEIRSDEPGAADDIKTLNLNLGMLKENRKAVIDGLDQGFRRRRNRGRHFSREELLRLASQWEECRGGKLKEMCQVAVYWLTKAACGRR